MGFAEDVLKFQQKALADANRSICNATEGLLTNVVALSPDSPTRKGPYSTGVVKGNWYTAINGFNYSVDSTPDPSGASSLSRIKATLATMPFLGKDATVTLTNSTSYVNFVENVGWPKDYPGNNTGWDWSGKSGPYSMVKTSVSNFRGKYM